MRKILLFILVVIILLIPNNASAKSKFNREWKEIAIEKEGYLAKNSDDLIIKYELAVAYANLGQIEESTEMFKSINSKKNRNKLKEKLVIYEELVKKDSDDIINNNYLAFAYYIVHKYNQAEIIYKKISELDSNNIWAYNYMAVVQHKLKEYDRAEKSLKKSLELDDNQYTHFLLGANYYKKGKFFKAMYHIGKGGKAVKLFLD